MLLLDIFLKLIKLIIFLITALMIANVYTDGKYLALIKSNKKYLQILYNFL